MTEKPDHETQTHEPLSPAGVARRRQMLGELDAAMARRNFQRRAVPIAAAASLVMLALVAFWANRVAPSVKPEGQLTISPRPVPVARAVIQLVATDPNITARLSTTAMPPGSLAGVQMIDDQELQQMLRAVGQPDGLVRVGGRTRVASEVVPRPDGEKPSDAG